MLVNTVVNMVVNSGKHDSKQEYTYMLANTVVNIVVNG